MEFDKWKFIAGTAVGLKDWLRITFSADPSALREGMQRMKSFYQRHATKQ
jgi:tyrosine aminotransferase